MIIDDQHKFVFVHIPKCAGTTIRQALQQFDSTHGRFAHAHGNLPGVGRIDMGHIPLCRLKDYFPEEYKKVKQYFSVAVVREPYTRFCSSLYQHLAMYGERPVKTLTRIHFKNALDNTIKYLDKNKNEACLNYNYIHFQRQNSYVFDNGERLINRLYSTLSLDRMFEDISEQVGKKLKLIENKHFGQAVVYKSSIARLGATFLSPFYTPKVQIILPQQVKNQIKKAFYNRPKDKFDDILNAEIVYDFVSDYYAEDVELYQKIKFGVG